MPADVARERGCEDRRLKCLGRVVRAGRYHLAWAMLLRRLARTRPDIVQFSGGRFPVDGLATAWLARRRRAGRPVLISLAHSPLPFNEQRATGEVLRQSTILNASLGLAYRSVDSLIVLGEQSAADLRAGWADVGDITVVPHGDSGHLPQRATGSRGRHRPTGPVRAPCRPTRASICCSRHSARSGPSGPRLDSS